MFVKPNPGRAVRDPVKGSLLPESGAEVPDNSFWRRRLRDEDVSIMPTATVTTPAAAVIAANPAPANTVVEDKK
ncbi:DUF2635 domain-containing protein [Sodalis ligni]|uniref:DUF2635 domain-containing protein n=1 Tax=Sodalis ligni TaxID=2697027 RepID=UPI00193F28AE|nr:DUF2635 domain-containing protein [Sodalis ligni]QWA09792.1 DUF2635 domain-containing protein [Sodalis ligni]